MSLLKLCSLEQLPDGGSLGVQVDPEVEGHDALLVRRGDRIYAYWNRCPHTGASLDWMPHNFLDSEAELIVCALHGARFTINSGVCVAGPCVGQALESIEVQVIDGDVTINT